MPLIRLVCPHCEFPIEVQVTSVTRTRVCPQCARPIVLQFSTKAVKTKRRAVLIKSETLEEIVVETSHQSLSQQQPVHERIKHDPEVAQSARQLWLGLMVVVILVAVLVAGHHFQWWPWTLKMEQGARDEHLNDTTTSATVEAQREVARDNSSSELLNDNGNREVVLSGKPATDAAMQEVKKFLEAGNVEERLAWVRDRNLMEAKIRSYYETHPSGPIAYQTLSAAPSSEDGPRFVFQVVLSSGVTRELHASKAETDKIVIDWASFVIYSEMEWSEFMRSKPTTPQLFRLYAQADEQYRGEFNNADQIGCVRLTNPLSEESKPIFAYYEKFTALGRELEFLLKSSGRQTLPITLTLRFPIAAQVEDQVWIDERVAEGWMARGR